MGKYHNEVPPLFGYRLSRADAPVGTTFDETDSLAGELADATRGKFDIVGVLGRNEFATVYLAVDVFLRRQVAIKVIRLAANEDADAAEQFRRDAKILGSLSHPHIVPVYRINQVGRLVYLVMRYIDGRGLDRILDEHGTLAVDVARLIVGEVADALDLSHEYGILHRDVKPANILVGRDGMPNVMDFRLAHISRSLTRTIAGKTPSLPYYTSPEQCVDGTATTASDQYSLAAVAYEMLAGRPPFDGRTAAELKEAHIAATAVPLADVRDGVPPAVADAVRRALSKHPADRWPTIAAFAMAMASDVMANRTAVRADIAAVVGPGDPAHAPPAAPTPAASPATDGKVRPGRSRGTARRTRRVRTLVFVTVVVVGVAAAILVPRILKERAAAQRVAARILQGTGDTTSAAASAAKADRDRIAAVRRADAAGPPPKVLGVPGSCDLMPSFTTRDLLRRNKAILRLCVSVDRTTLTIGNTELGTTSSGARDVEVDPGTFAYSAQRDGCQTREGTVMVIAGEYRVVPPKQVNPICGGTAAGRKP